MRKLIAEIKRSPRGIFIKPVRTKPASFARMRLLFFMAMRGYKKIPDSWIWHMPGPVYTVAEWNGLGVNHWNQNAQGKRSEGRLASTIRSRQLVSSKKRKYVVRFYANRLLEGPSKLNKHKIAWAWYYYAHVAIPFNASAIRSIPNALRDASDSAYECIDNLLRFIIEVIAIVFILPLRTILSPFLALVAIWWYWPAIKNTPRKDSAGNITTNKPEELL